MCRQRCLLLFLTAIVSLYQESLFSFVSGIDAKDFKTRPLTPATMIKLSASFPGFHRLPAGFVKIQHSIRPRRRQAGARPVEECGSNCLPDAWLDQKRKWGSLSRTCINQHCASLVGLEFYECIANHCRPTEQSSNRTITTVLPSLHGQTRVDCGSNCGLGAGVSGDATGSYNEALLSQSDKRRWGDMTRWCINSHCASLTGSEFYECVVIHCGSSQTSSARTVTTVPSLHGCGSNCRPRVASSKAMEPPGALLNGTQKRRWGDLLRSCINSYCTSFIGGEYYGCIANHCNPNQKRIQ